jgi:hypothetical protein
MWPGKTFADEELGDRADDHRHEVDGEQNLATELVGQPAAREGSQQDPDEGRRNPHRVWIGRGPPHAAAHLRGGAALVRALQEGERLADQPHGFGERLVPLG